MSKYVYTYGSVDNFQAFREEVIELAIRSQMIKNHGRSARHWRINSITEVEEG